ncbi:uracil-xanthine permease [Clostridia bacterium]|nr:uracil-xanthine permease [Clostridia bacterium]
MEQQNQLSNAKLILLGLQHAFTMFGATILVPILTGLDISVCLVMAGVGTLLFHLVTKGKVPAFLGSSFAFIPPMLTAAALAAERLAPLQLGEEALRYQVISYVTGGIVVAGLVYLLLAALVAFFGVQKVLEFFPPVVTGPIIIVIGLRLAPTALSMAGVMPDSTDLRWWLALISFTLVAAVSVYAKGFLRMIPVMIGLSLTYLVALVSGNIDLSAFHAAELIGMPHFTLAKFDLSIVLMVAPVALATMVEHIGDIMAIGETAGQDFAKDPGLHRTLLGDGLATAISAMLGGPANTTYSENTGVLALTKVYDPRVMRIAAVVAILLGFIPKLNALISSIPLPVIGGISIILFGMIASVGARSLVEHRVDFTQSRNLIIAAVIMVLGIGLEVMPVTIGETQYQIGGMALAAVAGILLNLVLPQEDSQDEEESMAS